MVLLGQSVDEKHHDNRAIIGSFFYETGLQRKKKFKILNFKRD